MSSSASPVADTTNANVRDALGLIRAYEHDVRRLIAAGTHQRPRGFQNLSPARLEVLQAFLERQDALRIDLVELVGNIVRCLVVGYNTDGVPITESDENLKALVNALDLTFRYGIRGKRSLFVKAKAYWDCVLECLETSDSTAVQFAEPVQKDVAAATSDDGLNTVKNMALSSNAKGRCWIQVGLMNKQLSAQVAIIISKETCINENYDPYAILLSEQMTIIAGYLASLESVDFNLFLNEQDIEKDSADLTGEANESSVLLPLVFETFIAKERMRVAKLGSNSSLVEAEMQIPQANDEEKQDVDEGEGELDSALVDESDEAGDAMEIETRVLPPDLPDRKSSVGSQNVEGSVSSLLEQKQYLEDELKSLNRDDAAISNYEPKSQMLLLNQRTPPSKEKHSHLKRTIAELTASGQKQTRKVSELYELLENKEKDHKNLEKRMHQMTEKYDRLHSENAKQTAMVRERDEERRQKLNNVRHVSMQTDDDGFDAATIASMTERMQALDIECEGLKKLNRSLLKDLATARSGTQALENERESRISANRKLVAELEETKRLLSTQQQRADDALSRDTHMEQEVLRLKKLLAVSKSQSQAELGALRDNLELARSSETELRGTLDQMKESQVRVAEVEEERDRGRLYAEGLEREGQELRQAKDEAVARLEDTTRQLADMMEARDLLRKERWMEDHLVHACTRCQTTFTIMNRKHHCRSCGRIYCESCSRHRLILSSSKKPTRVCDGCHAARTLNGTSSSFTPPPPTSSAASSLWAPRSNGSSISDEI